MNTASEKKTLAEALREKANFWIYTDAPIYPLLLRAASALEAKNETLRQVDHLLDKMGAAHDSLARHDIASALAAGEAEGAS